MATPASSGRFGLALLTTAVVVLTVLSGTATLAVPGRAAGHSPALAGERPSGLRTATSDVDLYDDFQTDTALNATAWAVNGSVASGLLASQRASTLPYLTGVAPTLDFSRPWGLSFSGVTANYTYADIQSKATFDTPFSAQTDVEVNASHGNTILFGITSASESEGVVFDGNLNSTDAPDFGIGVASNGAEGFPWNGGPILNLSPTYHEWFNLTISVDDTGFATLLLTDNQNGGILGETGYSIGAGAYYVYLGEYVDAPKAGNGPNVASYSWLYVNNTATSLAPSVLGVVADPSVISLGASTQIEAFLTGGLAPLTIQYSGLPAGCPSEDLLSFSCTPTASGSYTFTVNVTDSLGRSSDDSGSLVVNSVPALAITNFVAGPAVLPLGQSTLLAVVASGGTPPLSYEYSGLPSGCLSKNVSSLVCQPSQVGHYTVEVTVTDARGHETTAAADVNVTAATTTTSGPTYPEFFAALGIGAVGVAVGVVGIVLALRRRPPTPKQD